MQVTADARSFLKEKPDGEDLFAAERQGPREEGQVKLIGVKVLGSFDQYGDAEYQKRINRRFQSQPHQRHVLTEWEGKPHEAGHEPVFLTSLPVNQPLEVLDTYDLRSLIENCAFRELKQGWLVGKFPKKTEEAVRGHIFLTVVMFNLTNAYRTDIGKIWPSKVSSDNAWPGKIPIRCLSSLTSITPSWTSRNCSSSWDANRKSVGGLTLPKSATVTALTSSNSRPSHYGAILEHCVMVNNMLEK